MVVLLADVVIKGKRIGAVELSECDGAEVLRTDAVVRFIAPGLIGQWVRFEGRAGLVRVFGKVAATPGVTTIACGPNRSSFDTPWPG